MPTLPEDSSTPLSTELLKRILRAMDQQKFNQFVAALWREHGWVTTSESNRASVLASTAEKTRTQYALQTAEYRTNKIAGDVVMRYVREQESDNEPTPVIVSTGDFTTNAREQANIWNIKLVGGDELVNRVRSADAFDLVNNYSQISIVSNTTSEIEAILDQQGPHQRGESGQEHDRHPRPSHPWLTVLPGVALDRNWALRFCILATAAVLLVAVYRAMPEDGPVLLRLVRLAVYFSALGSLIGVFIAFYMDMKLLRQAETYWNPRPLVYLVAVAFTFGLAWLYYFYTRRHHLGGVLAKPALEASVKQI